MTAARQGMLRPCLTACEPAALHLVMCPFAGGSSGAFRAWRELDSMGLNMSLAVYPGREHRMAEPCESSIDALATQVAEAIARLPVRAGDRLVLAGHSMGAQVAFEACRRLERDGRPPDGLVLSGCHAPHLSGRRRLGHLDDADFVRELVAIGGCSQEVLADPALLPVFMPLLRADFRATEAYRRDSTDEPTRVRTPTLLLYGSDDDEAHLGEVLPWQAWLAEASEPVAIAGDHFYVTHRPRAVIGQVMRHFETDGFPI